MTVSFTRMPLGTPLQPVSAVTTNALNGNRLARVGPTRRRSQQSDLSWIELPSECAVTMTTRSLSRSGRNEVQFGAKRLQSEPLRRACPEHAGGSGWHAVHYHVESGFDAGKTEPLGEIYNAIHSQLRRDSQSLIHWFRVLLHLSAFATPGLPTCPVRQLQIVCKSSCQNSHSPRERS